MDDGITVTGVGQVPVTPDRLRLTLRLSCSAPDVSEAVSTLTVRTDSVLEAITERGVGRESVRTVGLHVDERWSGERRSQRTGFNATHRICVELADAADVGGLLAAVVEVAGNQIGIDQVETTARERPEQKRQARDLAFADAHTRAEHLAGLADRPLGVVAWLTEHPPDPRHGDTSIWLSTSSASSEDLAVQPGTTLITSVISVCWNWA